MQTMACVLSHYLQIVAWLALFVHVSWCKKVSPENTIVYGPAFNVDVVVPLRYFYIQAVDTKGRNYTFSPGKDTFQFKFLGRVRGFRDMHDREDGSFLVRFPLTESYKDLRMEITHNGKHVKGSPFTFKGMTYHEKCYCPIRNRKRFLNTYSCPTSYPQLEEDFKPFQTVNLTQLRTKAKNFGTIVHYTIKNNKVYRQKIGETTDLTEFIDEWFLSLARKVILPNVEFLFNLGDWPKQFNPTDDPPIIAMCSSQESYDIVIPTYEMTTRSLNDMVRDTNTVSNVQGHSGPEWGRKTPKAFFRGRDSHKGRITLLEIAKKRPELFDVGITRFSFYKNEEKNHEKVQRVSFLEHFKYKYQVSIDGTVAAYRFPFLLAGGSLVFKQDSGYYEHFYKELQPWVHYVPVKNDLSDLVEMIEWAKKNDKEAKKIAKAGQLYARDNLMSDKLYCYTLAVFQEYAKRQLSEPVVGRDMEHQAQPDDNSARCECERKKKKKTKKADKDAKTVKEEL